MIKLKDFLNGNDTVLFEGENGRYLGIMKIPTQYSNIYYIYKKSNLREKIFPCRELKDYNFYGIYNGTNNTLHLSSTYELSYPKIDISDIETSIISTELIELEVSVNEGVIEILGLDEEKLNVLNKNKIDEDYLLRVATDCVVNDNDYFEKGYSEYKICGYDKEYLEIKYILDKEITIKEEIEKYINDNKVNLDYKIRFRKALTEKINELKNDENLMILREVSKVMSDKTKKTLNIRYLKDGKEMTFKIENIGCLNGNKYISNYRIKEGRNKFEETYKKDGTRWGDNIYPQYIEEIIYSKKVLYSKKDFLESLNK